jgi:hypothetical protein
MLSSLQEFLEKTEIVDIPYDPPNTKEEYLEWSKYWPINFIEQEIYKLVKHT